MPSQDRETRRNVIVTALGFLFLPAAVVGIVLGTIGFDDQNSALSSGGHALASVGLAGLAGLVGYYERTWQLWRLGRSVLFLLLSGFFAVGLVVPAVTNWLFAVLVEVI